MGAWPRRLLGRASSWPSSERLCWCCSPPPPAPRRRKQPVASPYTSTTLGRYVCEALRACLVADRCAPCHTCGRHQELGCCLVVANVSHAKDCGCHRFDGSCLVPVKVVAATATFYVKPRHSRGVKIHRLRFGAAIVAEWRATAKKKKLRRRHTCSGRLWQLTKQPLNWFSGGGGPHHAS